MGFALAAGIALFPIVHGPEPLPEPGELRELVVLVRPGPAFYFPGPDGVLTGFDVDLARQFAAEKKLLLKFALADSAADVIAAIAKGEAHIGAGGLYRPLASTAAGKVATPPDAAAAAAAVVPPDVLWTTRVATAEPVLIYNRDGYKPANWSDLEGATVAFVPDAGFDTRLPPRALPIRESGGMRWRCPRWPVSSPRFRMAPSATRSWARSPRRSPATSTSTSMSRFRRAPSATSPGPWRHAWATCARTSTGSFSSSGATVPWPASPIATCRIPARSSASTPKCSRKRFAPCSRSIVPLFHDGQEKSGIEWRLLAAIAYQESQWDPTATSATGVRGIMQITEDTAKRLGIRDLLDPAQNVVAAARYLRDLKAKLPRAHP